MYVKVHVHVPVKNASVSFERWEICPLQIVTKFHFSSGNEQICIYSLPAKVKFRSLNTFMSDTCEAVHTHVHVDICTCNLVDIHVQLM